MNKDLKTTRQLFEREPLRVICDLSFMTLPQVDGELIRVLKSSLLSIASGEQIISYNLPRPTFFDWLFRRKPNILFQSKQKMYYLIHLYYQIKL